MKVSFEDCKRDLLAGNARAAATYRWWSQNPRFKDVVPFVQGFTHSHLYQISHADVERAGRTHSLDGLNTGDNREKVDDAGREVPFAFQHVFHKFIEDHCELPEWADFREWLLTDPWAKFAYTDPFLRSLGWYGLAADERLAMKKAIQWRLGLFFYSSLREIDFLVRMRDKYGLLVKHHLLADVLLKVDFWLGDVLIRILLPNARYKDQTGGRKQDTHDLFTDPFRVETIVLERQGRDRYCAYWPVSESQLDDVAAVIYARMAGVEL